jgi:hypothetical protein
MITTSLAQCERDKRNSSCVQNNTAAAAPVASREPPSLQFGAQVRLLVAACTINAYTNDTTQRHGRLHATWDIGRPPSQQLHHLLLCIGPVANADFFTQWQSEVGSTEDLAAATT